mmetsp:Transcript_116874/g.324916  ORF Transcript_116874/g.324916 Transcript_116874/m.324916 type:complete len:214 (+) Transcript_116874:313-954(+)
MQNAARRDALAPSNGARLAPAMGRRFSAPAARSTAGPLLGGVDVGGDHAHDADVPVVHLLDLGHMDHLDERQGVPEHHPLIVVNLALYLLHGLLGPDVGRILLRLLSLDSENGSQAKGEVQHMREGDEAQIAPVPLDCGVVLELQQANLQQPIDMVLNQEGDEDHALGRLQDVALLESLPQLWNVWHLLAPTVRSTRPRQRRLHLRDDGLPGQ